MIITNLFKIAGITPAQLLFLSTLLANIKGVNNQRLTKRELTHLYNMFIDYKDEINKLKDEGYIKSTLLEDGSTKYDPTDKLLNIAFVDIDKYFKEFYDMYPAYVDREGFKKSFLRANTKKCKREYKKIIENSEERHRYILQCLQFELRKRLREDSLGYMKTMWKWITNREWEAIDEEMRHSEAANTERRGYGESVL